MIVDTSAAFAVLANETDAEIFTDALGGAPHPRMSAVNLLELRIVIARRFGSADLARVDSFLRLTNMDIVPFDSNHTQVASSAYVRFGKGFHAAQLNFGDCAAYALAHLADEPLLFKGNDFSQTDIRSALGHLDNSDAM